MLNRPFEKYYKDIPVYTFLMTQFKYISSFNMRFILKKNHPSKVWNRRQTGTAQRREHFYKDKCDI